MFGLLIESAYSNHSKRYWTVYSILQFQIGLKYHVLAVDANKAHYPIHSKCHQALLIALQIFTPLFPTGVKCHVLSVLTKHFSQSKGSQVAGVFIPFFKLVSSAMGFQFKESILFPIVQNASGRPVDGHIYQFHSSS